MADEVKPHANFDRSRSSRAASEDRAPAHSGPTADESVAAGVATQKRLQPDPALRLSAGRVGAGSIALVAVVCAIVIGVVLWGLNSPTPSAQDVNTAASASTNPPGPGTAGAGTPNPLPKKSAKSNGKG